MLRILIVEDHAIVRLGLRHVLLSEFPFARIDEIGNAEALPAAVFRKEYDLAIVDIVLPGRSGIDVIQQLVSLFPRMPILVLSAQPENSLALRVLKAGASCYMNKEESPEELIRAVRNLLAGKKYINSAIAGQIISQIHHKELEPKHLALSNREFEVLKLIASGKSLIDIGRQLSLSVSSVSTYRQRILKKADLKSNAEITRYAIENNLI